MEVTDLANLVFRDIFDIKTPYPEQLQYFVEVWQRASNGIAPVTLLKLPTGYGKTEALIGPYFGQIVANRWTIAPRVIYSLPTQALCNQLYNRILKYAENAETKFKHRIVVEVQHGGKSEDPYFVGDIVVTTLDQLLYGYARALKHIYNRVDIPAGSISFSHVILDEAHMYSAYTHALVKALLEIFHRSEIPISLSTATMPTTLLADMMQGLSNATIVDFKQGHVIKRHIKTHVIDHELLVDGKLNESARKLVEDNKNVLIVCNTVMRAIQVWQDLRDSGYPGTVLVHSRFTLDDRNVHENKVVDFMGKNRGSKKGVVVTTQVCEAGLDISADLLITECAPADALVQRAGRCARWEDTEGDVYVFKSASHLPYEEGVMNLTWSYLQENPGLDFSDWMQTMKFVDKLPYSADEIAARESLDELYDATLYAESRPSMLSAREDAFISVSPGEWMTKQSLINVPYSIADDDRFKREVLIAKRGVFLTWDFGQGKWVERRYVAPYGIYQGKPENYDHEKGLHW